MIKEKQEGFDICFYDNDNNYLGLWCSHTSFTARVSDNRVLVGLNKKEAKDFICHEGEWKEKT